MSSDRARRIKLLLFDVDGVLTDGTIWLFPAPGGAQQTVEGHLAQHEGASGYGFQSPRWLEAKGFHAHDGIGISLARLGRIKTGLITKRISETVALRARDLKLDHVHQGIKDKLSVFQEIIRQEKLSAEEAAYMGDDIIDLPVMRACGLAIAVANARDNVKAEAQYVTPHRGGDGALRDAIEFILQAQGRLDDINREYMEGKRKI